MNASAAHEKHSPERGFVLIGIIMIVLALTILGLSLFSLSTYEAQFMQRSLDQQQALQSALGGIDRARYALVAKNRLDRVKIGLPLENVSYVRATQLKPQPVGPAVLDSSGIVDWSGNNIHIESVATVDGITRWAEGWYVPHQIVNWYSRLMTLANTSLSIEIQTNDAYGSRVHPSFSDSVWIAANDASSWLPLVAGSPPVVSQVAVPIPNVSNFILTHPAMPYTPAPTDVDYMLHAPISGPPAYFYTDIPQTQSTFSYYDRDNGVGAPHQIHVTGHAIWCLPHGVRFNYAVNVVSDGDPNACLVIVAGRGNAGAPGFEFAGIWFFSGLVSYSVPVILVTNDEVLIESYQDTGAPTDVRSLSIFASHVWLKGPTTATPGAKMALSYGDYTAMKDHLDFLMSFGALPNSSAPSYKQLSLQAGTWRVTP